MIGATLQLEQSQDQLFTVRPERNVGNRDKELLGLVKLLERNELLIPQFQRDYVWKDRKLAEWIETVISKQAVGCVVTYQVGGQGPEYLADGFQRLTATARFLRAPSEYGFDMDRRQAEAICAAFEITVQHRHYKSHFAAMRAFQNLNKGTAATPAEFHKGEMTLTQLGSYAYEHIPRIIKAIEAQWLSGRTVNRAQESRLLRDTFALFFQYISAYKGKDFWSLGRQQSNRTSIESKLADFMETNRWTETTIDKQLKNFSLFLASEMAMIRQIAIEFDSAGKAFSPSSLRWLFHLAIWRKNNQRPVETYLDFLRSMFNVWKDYGYYTSKISLPHTQPVQSVTLPVASLNCLNALCKAFGNGLNDNIPKKTTQRALGYDDSHIEPFAISGNNETTPEPASMNRARGMKPMKEGQEAT